MQAPEIYQDPEAFHEQLKKIAQAEEPPAEVVETPEPPAEQKAEQAVDDDGEEISNSIPYSRFKKTNEEKKRLAEEKRALELQIADMKARLEMSQTKEPVKQEVVEEPANVDPIDPEAHKLYLNEMGKLKKELQEAKELAMQATQGVQFEGVKSKIMSDRSQFIAEKPDYDLAYKHVFDMKVKEANRIGMQGDNAVQWATQFLGGIAMRAVLNNGNAAEEVYGLAQDYGYSAKAKQNDKPAVDLEKRERAIEKTTSPRAANAGVGFSSASNPVQAMKTKTGRIDPEAFHAALNRLRSSNQ